VVVLSLVGAETISLGQWWVSSVPSDTNEAAVVFTLPLVPPGAPAAQLAVSTSPIPRAAPSATAARYLLVGAMLGLTLGSLLGPLTAALTWSTHCPQTSYGNCFSLSSVVSSSALVLGAACGLEVGLLTGLVSWWVRRRADPG
jgi:hypothetical protein